MFWEDQILTHTLATSVFSCKLISDRLEIKKWSIMEIRQKSSLMPSFAPRRKPNFRGMPNISNRLSISSERLQKLLVNGTVTSVLKN